MGAVQHAGTRGSGIHRGLPARFFAVRGSPRRRLIRGSESKKASHEKNSNHREGQRDFDGGAEDEADRGAESGARRLAETALGQYLADNFADKRPEQHTGKTEKNTNH